MMKLQRVALFVCIFLLCGALPPPAGITEASNIPAVSTLLSYLEPDGFTTFSAASATAALEDGQTVELLEESDDEDEDEDEDEEDEDDDDEDDMERDNAQALEEWTDDLMADADQLISRHSDYRRALRKYRLASVLGNADAAFSIFTLLLSLESTSKSTLKRDIPGAIHALNVAAAQGHSDAQAMLGMFYSSGYLRQYGIEQSIPKALVHWQISAANANVYSNCALGFRYMYGIDVEKSCEKAAEHYKQAAHAIVSDSRVWPSINSFLYGHIPLASTLVALGRQRLTDQVMHGRVTGEDTELFYYYRHSAEMGNLESMTMIASLLLNGGLGQNPDPVMGREYLERAVEGGYAEAHGLMGYLKMREGNFSGAILHFRWAAGFNEKSGHYALGMIHYYGILGMKVSLSHAAMHFKLAGEEGHADAAFMLARMYWKGEGVEKSAEDAEKWFTVGARGGNIQSMYHLGQLKRSSGLCEDGLELFKQVAESGDWSNLFEAGWEAVRKKENWGAIYGYLQAGIAGIELGQYNAAMLLSECEEDWEKELAVRLFELSGIQGRGESFIMGGDLAFKQGDVPVSKQMYESAGRQNVSEGWFNLGLMNAKGVGGEVDRDEALRYLELARSNGGSTASVLAKGWLKVWWWSLDIWEWWMEGREAGKTEGKRLEHVGEDVAIVGGLLVVLVAVLVLRTKRMARER